jgi:ferredoxin
MPYVVTDNCRKCRFTDCVEVCPVDCFWADDEMLYIDPDTCIDCGACEPVCPVQAIYPLEELPADKASWAQVNADKIVAGGLENITETQDPLPGAEERKKALGF